MSLIQSIKKMFGFSSKEEEQIDLHDLINELKEENSEFLVKAWEQREQEVYPSLFKNMPEDIFTPQTVDEVPMGGVELMLSCAGVFEIPPTEDRRYWVYLTSGLSNPFGDEKEEISGYGFELMLRTPEQSAWAISLLYNLMGYVLGTGQGFGPGHRMPLNSPMNASSTTALTTVLFWPPEDLKATFTLISGQAELLELHGITEEEYEYAKANSSEALYQKLTTLMNFPVVDLERGSCIKK